MIRLTRHGSNLVASNPNPNPNPPQPLHLLLLPSLSHLHPVAMSKCQCKWM